MRRRTVEMELSPSYRHSFLLEIGAALLSLRKGGAAVLSLGDLFTRFTAGGLYLAFRCFERMTLCRTFASCAAGGEKVVVLQGFLGKVSVFYKHLLSTYMLRTWFRWIPM